jgi:hypothetical protein
VVETLLSTSFSPAGIVPSEQALSDPDDQGRAKAELVHEVVTKQRLERFALRGPGSGPSAS